MRGRLGARMGVVASSLALLLAGCGVPLQDSAQPLPPEVIPPPIVIPTATPTTTPSPSVTESPSPTPTADVVDLFFVREDGLVPLPSDLPSDGFDQVSAEVVLERLAIGPPVETGLRSVVVDPLTGTPLVSVYVPSDPAQSLPIADVTIAVSEAFGSLPAAEQVLLLGQVVLSLSSAGYATVSVVDQTGSPLAVPLPDGRLLDRPATALDYATLIRPV